MIDSLYSNLERSKESQILQELGVGENYAILTLHRPSNVDDKENFSGILGALETIGKEIQLVFPIHLLLKKWRSLSVCMNGLKQFQILF